MKRAFSLLTIVAGLLVAAPAGKYSGTWTSDGGVNSGNVNITLTDAGDGDLTFTYQDQTVKPKKVTAKIAGGEVDFVCELDLEGFRLKTTFHGMAEGNGMSGKYQSTSMDDGSPLDSGTWKVTQQ